MHPLTIAALAALGAAVALALYGTLVEPYWLRVHRETMRLEGMPAELEGLRIVQLSDLHIGDRVPDAYLRRAFRAAHALAPDVVVVTGDVITFEDHVPPQLGELVGEVPHGRLGTFAVLGNHDYGPPQDWDRPDVAEEVADALRAAGVRVLRNEVAEAGELQVVGIDDIWARAGDIPAAFSGLEPQRPAVVLCHNPDTLDRPGWGGFRGWALAGHTHGGQVWVPFAHGLFAPVADRRYVAGRVELGEGRTLYVNRGIGFLIPIRIGVRPEITLYTLASA